MRVLIGIFLIISVFMHVGCETVHKGTKTAGTYVGKGAEAVGGVTEGGAEAVHGGETEEENPFGR